jgi:hypothetical protein
VTFVYWTLAILVVAGAVFATVLAALEHWIAFFLFLVVFVIGVTALTVQVVMTT